MRSGIGRGWWRDDFRPPVFLVGVLALLFGGLGAAVAVGDGASGVTVPLLALAQTVGVVWLAALGWTRNRQWASVHVIVAASWTLAFLVPSWLYVFDLAVFDVAESEVPVLAVVNLSLFSLILGSLFTRNRTDTAEASGLPPREIQVAYWSWPWILFWTAAGLGGMVLLFRGPGGLVEFLTNLDQEGRYTTGRVYFVWLALFIRYAAQVALYRRWATGQGATVGLVLWVAAAIGVTALLGARLFVAVALVEIVLFHAIVRRPLPLRVLVPVTLAIAFVVILVGGAAKRYQNYQAAHAGPDMSFARYALHKAPAELGDAYANNYADGVRLIALGQVVVPQYAPFEHGKLFVRYALQPIPRALRPKVSRADALTKAMYPGGGYAHAIPLQTSAYVQFGVAGVTGAFLLLGVLVGVLERRLRNTSRASFTTVVLLTSLVVAIPSYLRASEAGGFALAAVDVLGLTLVAFTAGGGLRRVRLQLAGRASSRREASSR